jgi:Ca2+-binding EF-hand superfamily protein
MIRAPMVLFALAGLATPALAQTYTPAELSASQADFAKGDVNKDGAITQDEVDKRMVELAAAGAFPDVGTAKRMGTKWLKANDKNKDGKVEETESRELFVAKMRRQR